VLGAFRTPKSKVGYSESANKASMLAADTAWNAEVIQPLLIMVDSVMDQKWLPIYGNPGLTGSFDSPVPTDREEIRLDVDLAVKHGLMTDNEARERLGLEPIDRGDDRYKPFNLVPVGVTILPPEKGFAADDLSSTSAVIDGEAKNIRGLALAGGVEDGAALPFDRFHKAIDETYYIKLFTKAFWTNERKDAHWLGFAKATEAQEKQWRPVMHKLFTEQEVAVQDKLEQSFKAIESAYAGWSKKKVAAAIKKDVRLDGIESLIMEFVEDFKADGLPILRGIYQEAGVAAVEFTGSGIAFDMDNPRAREYLEARSITFARMTNETTASEIRTLLSKGIAEGETIDDLSKRVAKYYDQARDYRTDRIARTETIASSNAGSFDGYKQAGVEYKAWLSSRDPATRIDHLELDSKYSEERGYIPMDAPFEVAGVSAMFPGEFGVPEQDCNCRCTHIPVIPEV